MTRAVGTSGLVRSIGVITLSGASICFSGCSAPRVVSPAEIQPVSRQVAPLSGEARQQLATALSSETAQARANAAEALISDPLWLESVAPELLSDGNAGVRAVTATAIGDAAIRGAAFEASVSLLDELTRDDSPFVRLGAVYALARLGRDVDRAPLASALLSDPSPRVRAQAAFVFGKLGEPSALPMLRQATRARIPLASSGEMKLLELQIAEAMVRLGETDRVQVIRAALFPSRPEELEAAALAVQILGSVGDRGAIDQLIYLSEQRDEMGNLMPAEVRLGIASALSKLGQPEGWFIAEQYRDSDRSLIRAQAAAVYGLTRGPQNGDRLADLLEDESELVRVAAAGAVIRNLAPAGPRIESTGAPVGGESGS
ncbi:MAG: HEAT repeat domain-containing protein [Planctomycetota bacterium]